MSNIETLLEAGAQCVTGSLILGGKELGRLRDGELHLTEDGRAKLEELAKKPDEPREPAAAPAPAKKAAAKKTASKKAAEPVEPEPAPQEPSGTGEPLVDDIDDMLKDLG